MSGHGPPGPRAPRSRRSVARLAAAAAAAATLLLAPGFGIPGAFADRAVVAAIPPAPRVAAIEELVARYHELRLFNGAVLVARGDSVLLERGYGEANMEWGVPNAPDTRFRIGSITKQFTAALVLRLAEEGALRLDAPVSELLPDYPRPAGERITVHHLLTHTSGIPSYTGFPDFEESYARDPHTPDSLVAVFSRLPLEFEPGTDWNYSNSGYFLLGAIVEALTGEPYDRVLRARLLDPLGLEDTGYDHHDRVLERRAAGYVRTPAGYRNAAYLDTSIPYAAGSLYSTVRDLHAWTRALHGGAVFEDPATLARMTTPRRNGYGYGLFVGKRSVGVDGDSVRFVGHGGGINGFISQLTYFRDAGYTVVVLDNTTSGSVDALARGIGTLLHGGEPELPKIPIADVVHRTIEEEGVEAGLARYDELRGEAAEAYDLSEDELGALGRLYLDRGEIRKAIAVLRRNADAHPEAFAAHERLGDAYREAGRHDLAVAAYRRSLELDPTSESVRSRLRELGVEADVPVLDLAPAVLERYVGRYLVELGPGLEIPVRRRGEALEARLPGGPWTRLVPRAEHRFVLAGPAFGFDFRVGGDGVVRGLLLRTPSGEEVSGEKLSDGS